MPVNRLLPAALALSLSLLVPAVLSAQEAPPEVETVLTKLEENRRMVVLENMLLDVAEREKFWEVYTEYRAAATELDAGRMMLLRDFRGSFDNLSTERAQTFLRDFLDLEAKTVALRQDYMDEFIDVIGAKRTLRFFQIDIKVDSIIRTEMSAANPLATE